MDTGHNRDLSQQSQEAPSSLQVETQPLDEALSNVGTSSPPSSDDVWGQLYPHSGSFPRISLSQEHFTFGKASSCNYVIKESDMGSKNWFIGVSRMQCEIIKTKHEDLLKD